MTQLLTTQMSKRGVNIIIQMQLYVDQWKKTKGEIQ